MSILYVIHIYLLFSANLVRIGYHVYNILLLQLLLICFILRPLIEYSEQFHSICAAAQH